MDVTWLGGSCVRLQAGAVSVLTDPFDLQTVGSALSADVVTLSVRAARDRLLVGGSHRLIDGPGEYEIKGVPVTGVSARRHVTDGQDAGGRNVVYSIQMDGVVACHLGRLNRQPSSQEVQELGAPDLLLVPLGEPQGLAVQHAVALASQLEAKLLVPLLLGGADDRVALERFCRELGSDPSNTEPRLSVTASSLPATARVVVLGAAQLAPPGG